jgi:hypothetical protein
MGVIIGFVAGGVVIALVLWVWLRRRGGGLNTGSLARHADELEAAGDVRGAILVRLDLCCIELETLSGGLSDARPWLDRIAGLCADPRSATVFDVAKVEAELRAFAANPTAPIGEGTLGAADQLTYRPGTSPSDAAAVADLAAMLLDTPGARVRRRLTGLVMVVRSAPFAGPT